MIFSRGKRNSYLFGLILIMSKPIRNPYKSYSRALHRCRVKESLMGLCQFLSYILAKILMSANEPIDHHEPWVPWRPLSHSPCLDLLITALCFTKNFFEINFRFVFRGVPQVYALFPTFARIINEPRHIDPPFLL